MNQVVSSETKLAENNTFNYKICLYNISLSINIIPLVKV